MIPEQKAYPLNLEGNESERPVGYSPVLGEPRLRGKN